VGAGEVGAVFCAEASRLARNGREWHQLLHLCASADTLIVDGDGVYSPRTMDGKLILGIKGAMSELELGLIRRRAQAAIDARVERGEFLLNLPPGYAKLDGRCAKHPDGRVREAVALVFRKFEEFESVRQTVVWLRQEGVEIPVKRHGPAGWETTWRPASYDNLRRMLIHPFYAGAYAFGVNARVPGARGEGNRPLVRRSARPEDWKRLILDQHEAYIGWERYRRNVELIEANGRIRGGGRVAVGKCLLSTLMRCGRCGRTVRTQSGESRRASYPRYYCVGSHDASGGRRCMGFSGKRVEEEVVAALRGPLSQGLREAARRLPLEMEARLDELRRSSAIALAEARRHELRCARRRESVDAGNPHLVRELDARWDAAIRSRLQCEQRMAALDGRLKALDAASRRRIEKAAGDFRALWEDPGIDQELRRRAMRAILDAIVVEWEDGAPTYTIRLHWKGGRRSAIVLRKYRALERRRSSRETADLIADLSRTCPPWEVAKALSLDGRRTANGKTWTQGRVMDVLRRHRYPTFFSRENAALRAGTTTLGRAADEMGVSFSAALRLARAGILPASQPMPGAPWRVRRAELDSPAVRREIARIKRGGRGFGRGAVKEGQLEFGGI